VKRHFNENEIAQYAEYLNGDNVEPSPKILKHG